MYKLSEDVMLYQEDGKQYLINTVTGKVFILNDVAQIVVNCIKDGKGIEEIKNEIGSRYTDASHEQVEGDINNYLLMLKDSQSLILC